MSKTPTTYGLPKKREKVIEALKLAYTNQNLEDHEYERRLNEATNAKSIEELKLVIFDFPADIRASIFPEVTTDSSQQPVNSTLPVHMPKMQVILGKDSRNLPELSNALPKISAILSEQKLDFRLSQVPETPINIRVESVLSSTVIDLRNENLRNKQINVHISGALGDIKIMLPRGATIYKNIQLLGSEYKIQDKQRSWIQRLTGTNKKNDNTEDIQLTVNILGTFWLGNIKVIY